MPYVIAVAGKGGTGKTSIAALIVKFLIHRKRGPILAVDADSNACLNEALGVQVHATVGGLREKSLDDVRSGGGRPGGMSMDQLFDYQVQQSLVEADGFDLMVMGRPEGPGCYCAANNIIRKYTDILSEKYAYVVIDNEAGMEHLSRRTTHSVDMLFIISDPTVKGIQTQRRIGALVDELKLDVKERCYLINRVMDGTSEELLQYAKGIGIGISGMIPNDPMIFEFDLKGRPVFGLPDESNALSALYGVLNSINIP